MRRKNYWFLFAVLLLSLISLSPSFEFTKNVDNLSPGKDPAPPSQVPDIPKNDLGPLQVAVQLNRDELETLKKMNEEFKKRTGAVVEIVSLESIGSNKETFIQTMNLGEGPDVILADSQWIKELAVKGLLMPIDASQAVVPDSQFLGGLLSPVQWNGYQWGIPFDFDPYILVGRTKEEKLPSSPKSWIERKKNIGKKPLFALDSTDPYAFAAAVSTLGGDPEQPDKEVLSMFAPPAGKSWIYLSDVEAETKSTEQANEDAVGASVIIGAFSDLSKDLPEDVSFLLAGYPSDKQKPIVKSRSYAVTAQNKSSTLAIRWITEMTSKEAEGIWSRATGKLPALTSIVDSVINGSERYKEDLRIVLTLLENGEAMNLNFGRYDGFYDYSSSASDLLHGRITIKEFQEQYKE